MSWHCEHALVGKRAEVLAAWSMCGASTLIILVEAGLTTCCGALSRGRWAVWTVRLWCTAGEGSSSINGLTS